MGKDYKKNKEDYLRRAEKHYQLTREDVFYRLKRMVTEAKSRAFKRGIPFSITHEDVMWNDVCPVLGLKLKLNNVGAGGCHDSPSLDKIQNHLGYIPGNVRIISNRANKLKNDMSKEEAKLLFENWSKI